jgi:iron complex outermembrane recepter protein
VHHQTTRVFSQEYKYTPGRYYKTDLEKFSNTLSHHRERNTVLDFSAGKDVGLGLFGSQASSVLKAGVRFAQFTSKSAFDLRARPDLSIKYFTYGPLRFVADRNFHTYYATGHASRSFRGVGPALSWNGSAPLVGDAQHGEIVFDWGVNASVLFGKQKARVRHQESGHYKAPGGSLLYTTVYPASPVSRTNARSVSVPNVGGMAGISFRRGDAKISFGYRADFFFDAVDGGIDTRKSTTLGFNGPFASISVGLGD